MATRMLQRRGTAAEFAADNPVLADGEIGYERDTRVLKIGDGATAWTALPSAWQTILPIASGTVGLTIKGRPGQTGDYERLVDDGGNTLAKFDNTGTLTVIGPSPSTASGILNNNGMSFTRAGAPAYIKQTGIAGTFYFVGSNVASEDVNMLEMDPVNGLRIGSSTFPGALPGTAVRLRIRANPAGGTQVVDLQQWQANDGTVQSRVSKNADTIYARFVRVKGTAAADSAITTSQFSVETEAVGTIGIIVRAFLNQTGDLFAGQDSTGANTLARITASGGVHGTYWKGMVTSAIPGSSNSMSQGATNGIGLVVKKIAAAVSDIFSVIDENNNQYFGVAASGTTWMRQQATGTTPAVLKAIAGSTVDLLDVQDGTGVVLLAIDKGAHLAGRGPLPTVQNQASLGTGPPASTVVGSDQAATISFGTGTTPAAGGFALRLSFNRPFSGIGAVSLTPGNFATAALGIPYVVNVATTNIDIGFPNAPAASQPVGTYKLHVLTIGN